MNNILNKAIITKVDNITRVDFIKAKEHAKYNPDELEILKAELKKWENENNRLKKQLRIIKTLSKHKITDIEDIYKIEVEKDAKLLSANVAEIIFLNFLPDKTLLKSSWDYQKLIDDFNNELEYTQKAISTFENIINNITNSSKHKTIPTYNGLGYTMTKPQHELIVDLLKKQKSENDKITLQNILANHVMEDKDFTKEQKREILQFIKDNKSKSKVIENCLIFPLTRDEKRILRILREEMYEQIQTGRIATTGLTVYEAYISYDKLFTLYGVNNDNHKATKPIKDILFGRSSKGLRKHIIVEDKQAISTQLILNIEEVKGKINLSKKDVGKGFIITMPSFLFVGEDKLDAKNYYNQENEGHRRFMKTGNMAQSDAASNIACKLEMLCHSTLHNKNKNNKVVEWDLKTIVNIAGYQKRYKKSPTEMQNKIENIFNSMIKAEYLIESWQLIKGKYGQDQYIIKPLKFI
jgi:hypothetical protein